MSIVRFLETLIAPMSSDEFFESYWENNFLHLRVPPERFSHLFSSSDIESWLASVRSGLPDSIVVTAPEGADQQTSRYRPRETTADAIGAAFSRGSSVILNHLEDWPAFLKLAKGLGHDFHADIGVNAYLTPRGARTFPIHTDEHDVLILHLEGEKLWRLHEFGLLQIGLTQKKNMRFTEEWYGRTKTPQLAEILLKPGELLYIPRGMPHYAVAQGSTCLHLTISITPLYWIDFLKIATECVAIRSQALRRSLPPGFVENDELGEQMRVVFRDVMRAFQEEVVFDEVLSAARRNRVSFQGFAPDGHFQQLIELGELDGDSEVERRTGVLCFVGEVFDRGRNSKSSIWFGSGQLAGPLHLMKALEFIRDHPRFRIAELPGLDPQGQLTLVRRLIVEGLLRVAQEETCEPVLAAASG